MEVNRRRGDGHRESLPQGFQLTHLASTRTCLTLNLGVLDGAEHEALTQQSVLKPAAGHDGAALMNLLHDGARRRGSTH